MTLSFSGKTDAFIVVCSLLFFLACSVSLVLLIFLSLKCSLLIMRLGTCTFDVILLNLKFRNRPLCLQFCPWSDFGWCLILGDGLLTPHLLLLWNLLLMTWQVLLSFLKGIFIMLFGWIISKRKLKFFFGSLATMPLTLQLRMPYMSLSPSWCIICCAHAEPSAHLFIRCPFAGQFWRLLGMVYCSFEQYLWHT